MATPGQLTKRRWLGSSDLPAICGEDPFRTAADVQLALLHGVAPDRDDTARTIGKLCEGPLIQVAANTWGNGRRNVERRVAGHPVLVHIDFLLTSGPPVECKTYGLARGYVAAKDRDVWGDEYTDEVPNSVILQTHGHMLGVTQSVDKLTGHPDCCHVVALIAGRGVCLFRVPFNRDLAANLLRTIDTWWQRHIVDREAVTDSQPSLDTLKRLNRVPGKILLADEAPEFLPTLWEEKANEAATRLHAEKEEKRCKRDILALVGDAEGAWLPDGCLLTFYEQTRTGFDAKAFRAQHPDLYAEFETSTTYRVLRCKPAPPQLEGPKSRRLRLKQEKEKPDADTTATEHNATASDTTATPGCGERQDGASQGRRPAAQGGQA